MLEYVIFTLVRVGFTHTFITQNCKFDRTKEISVISEGMYRLLHDISRFSLSQAVVFPIHQRLSIRVYGEACIGVLGIQDINHFTSRDIGYYPFYFQGYGILCSIFWLLSGSVHN